MDGFVNAQSHDDLISFKYNRFLQSTTKHDKFEKKAYPTLTTLLPCLPRILTNFTPDTLVEAIRQIQFRIPSSAQSTSREQVLLCRGASDSLMLLLKQCVRLIDVVMITDVLIQAAPLQEPTSSLARRLGEVMVQIKASDLTTCAKDTPDQPPHERGPLSLHDTQLFTKQMNIFQPDSVRNDPVALADHMAATKVKRPFVVFYINAVGKTPNVIAPNNKNSYIAPLVGSDLPRCLREFDQATSVPSGALSLSNASLTRHPRLSPNTTHPLEQHFISYLLPGIQLRCIAIASVVNAATFDNDCALAGITSYRRLVVPDIEDTCKWVQLPESRANELQNMCPRRVFEKSGRVASEQKDPDLVEYSINTSSQDSTLQIHNYRCTECKKCGLDLKPVEGEYTWTINSTSALSALEIFHSTLRIAVAVLQKLQTSSNSGPHNDHTPNTPV
jgi:hypothetical protein